MNNIFGENLKQHCCGCRACEQACPQNCIQIKQDNEGFLLPFCMDENTCIECAACVRVCPTLDRAIGHKAELAYGLIHKNTDITNNSASGGAFSALASYVIDRGGTVFGCIMDKDLNVLTAEARNWEDLKAMQSSKYVQCDTNIQYTRIQERLYKCEWVLYCATPCQIAGLKKYLNNEYDTLILVDLFCHGVPAQGLFAKYLEYLGKAKKHPVEKLVFRDGQREWGTTGYYIAGNKFEYLDTDPFYYSFLAGNTYASICYHCPYANRERVGDISIGDFWGVQELYPEVDISRGVSAVLVNTTKGKQVFESIEDKVICFKSTVEHVSLYNTVLIEPTKLYEKRDELYRHFQKMPMEEFVKLYLAPNISITQRIKLRTYSFLVKLRLNFVINSYRKLKARKPRA
ncbi:MAG: Coenzyme F420 hydrogenase/dehydrogenase, beta subunit C-terminal domain [Clostridiaceae bacterium]